MPKIESVTKIEGYECEKLAHHGPTLYYRRCNDPGRVYVITAGKVLASLSSNSVICIDTHVPASNPRTLNIQDDSK